MRFLQLTELKNYSSKMKIWYDLATKFKVWECVWLYTLQFIEPYKLVKKINDMVYRIQKPGGKSKPKVAHLNLLAPYHEMMDVGD